MSGERGSYKVRWVTLGFIIGVAAGIFIVYLFWSAPPAKGQVIQDDGDHIDVPEIASLPDLLFDRSGTNPEEVAMIARYFDSPTIYTVPLGTTMWGGGLLVRLGDGFGLTHGPDEPLMEGQYVNLSPEPAVIVYEDGTQEIVGPMETVNVIRDWLRRQELPDQDPAVNGRTCIVQCGTGYYACCNHGNPPTCVCKPVAQPNHKCQVGGPGAITCGAGEGQIQP